MKKEQEERICEEIRKRTSLVDGRDRFDLVIRLSLYRYNNLHPRKSSTPFEI